MLKLTQPMMHGPAVIRLQETGDLLGFDRGPNDGIFGKDTEQVVKDLQKHLGIKIDGICGPKTWKAIRIAADKNVYQIKPIGLPSDIYDRRGKHPNPKLYKCSRELGTVNSVVLHQTGCKMPSTASGWDRLNAHIGITRDGDVIWVNDFKDWIWHAQRLSKQSVGIEVAGNFCGISRNMKTLWKGGGGPHTLTEGQVNGLNKAFELIKREIKIKHIFAHRQSSKMRTADPGQEIWQKGALPWLLNLDATDGGDRYSVGSGAPIPREWDPSRSTKYWG